MADQVCEVCGTSNSPDAQFCRHCDNYFWNKQGNLSNGPGLGGIQGKPPTTTAGHDSRSKPPRMEVTNPDVVLDPVNGALPVRVLNKSEIVEGYSVELIEPPSWLSAQGSEVRLRPDEDGELSVTFTAATKPSVAAQTVAVRLRVRSMNDSRAYADADVSITVPKVGQLVTVRPTPNLLRVNDTTTATFELLVDNEASNYEQQLELSGADPEAVVEFQFTPPKAVVPAAGSTTVAVQVHTPAPEPGQETTRQLTVFASNDQGRAQATIALVHKTSAAVIDPPLGLELEPSQLRLTDTSSGEVGILIDNRQGTRDRQVTFEGTDPERVIQFSFENDTVPVKARSRTRVGARLEAPRPAPGQEVTRQYTMTVSDGQVETEAQGVIVHGSSPSPIKTATILLEPEQLKIRDHDSGQAEVHIENKHGSLPLRVRLTGTDPERAVRFQFEPPSIDIPAGTVGRSLVRMSAEQPPSGEEVIRQIKIVAHDGDETIETAGGFTQETSTAAINSAKIRLEPEQVTVHDAPSGQFGVVVENRARVQRLAVGLSATDPEGVVHFSFAPPTLDIPPMQAGQSVLTVWAAQPANGEQVTRQLKITAADTNGSVEASGVFNQVVSEAPITTARIWLDPEQIYARGKTGQAAVIVDNTRGALPLQVYLTGSDPERAVRFSFNPAPMVVNPRASAAAQMTVSARRPSDGEQVVRNLRVAATDGREFVETGGTLIQTTPDYSPILRFLLTVFGGVVAIIAVIHGPSASVRLPPKVHFALDLRLWALGITAALVIVMLFGLTSQTGKLSRLCAVLLFLGALGYAAFLWFHGLDAAPISVVAVGAAVAYLGGMFAEP